MVKGLEEDQIIAIQICMDKEEPYLGTSDTICGTWMVQIVRGRWNGHFLNGKKADLAIYNLQWLYGVVWKSSGASTRWRQCTPEASQKTP